MIELKAVHQRRHHQREIGDVGGVELRAQVEIVVAGIVEHPREMRDVVGAGLARADLREILVAPRKGAVDDGDPGRLGIGVEGIGPERLGDHAAPAVEAHLGHLLRPGETGERGLDPVGRTGRPDEAEETPAVETALEIAGPQAMKACRGVHVVSPVGRFHERFTGGKPARERRPEERQPDGDDDHHRAERVDLRADRVAQHREDLRRHRLDPAGLPEQRAGDVVERDGEGEERPGEHRRQHDRQGDLEEGLDRRGAEAECGLLDVAPHPRQPRLHHEDHERQREDHMPHQEQEEALGQVEELQEQAGAPPPAPPRARGSARSAASRSPSCRESRSAPSQGPRARPASSR